MNYFKDCKNREEAKTIFRRLAKKLHPDHGGTHQEMMALTEQYEKYAVPIHERMNNSKHEDQKNKPKSNWHDQFNWEQEFKKTQEKRQEKVEIKDLEKKVQNLITELSGLYRKIRNLELALDNERDRYQKLFEDYEIKRQELEDFLKEPSEFENEWNNSSYFMKLVLVFRTTWLGK